MRILMTTMQLDIGGAETHIVELSKELARRGVEVFVASNGGAYEKELTDAGIKHIKVPFHTKNPMEMYKAYKLLKNIIFDYDIDIVHAHARIPAFLCALLQKRYHFRFVTTAHWVFNTSFPYNILTRWGDRSLAVSDDIKRYLIDNYGIDDDNIRVTINGIDTKKFSKDTDFSDIAEEFNLEDDKTRIVYVSRMDTDRSFAAHKLLEIAEELDEQIENLEILIVGGGNDEAEINAKATAVNLAAGRRMVITTGNRTDINKLVASGKIFIGVSRAALEAMAAEKPSVIAGNEGYIGIFNEDKLNAAISTNFCCRGEAETTAEKLKNDILTLLNLPDEELNELGEYSKSIVEKHYSVETMADDAMRMYVSSINGSKINSVSTEEFSDIDNLLLNTPSPMQSVKTDVMISGYYGFHNSGDDCILKAIIDSLRSQKPNIQIIALSNNPAETESTYNVKSIHRFNIPLIFIKLLSTKLLISGGGSLVQDVTSDKSLIYYLGIIRLAKLAGTKVMLYANGIGPIRKKKNYGKVRRALKNVDVITLREDSSLRELKEIGVNTSNTYVTADPAFKLSGIDEESTKTILEKVGAGDKDYFVVSLRPWKTTGKTFKSDLATVIKYVKNRYNSEPLYIPMQGARDREISETLLSQTGGYILNDITPSEIIGIIGRAKFTIGMRLHALIYAFSQSTPAIGLIYDPKVKAMMEYVGQHYMLPVENLNPLTLTRYIDEIMAERDTITASIRINSETIANKADKNTILALNLLKNN